MKIKLIVILLMCTSICAFSQITYKFDNLSRLIQVTNTNGSVVKYTYDELGNRTSKVITTASYAVNASANPVAGGTVAGSGSFSAGQSCTLTATPNAGYAFSNWTEGSTVVSTNASYTFTVSVARTLVANFVQSPVNYTINTSASPTAGGTTTGGGTYASGVSRTVTATPNTGYTFTNWTENGTVVSTSASYTFNLNANRTLVANFTLNNYAISANVNPTIGGTVTGAGSYNYGSSCTLTASSKTGYTFTNWTENGIEISTNSTLSFTVTAARSVLANFVATAYTLNLSNNALSLNATSNSSGTISVTSNTTWTANSNQTWLTVSPASGSNNGTLILTATIANTATTARTATVTVSGAGVANQIITVTQLGTAPALSLSNNTLSINAASNSSGTISITSNTAWSAISNQTWLTVSPASGSNNGTLTLTANSANTATTTRTATVTVSGTGVTAQTITVTQSGSIPDITNGLVAYYPFNGNANDVSGNNNNGVDLTGVTFVTGKDGQAAKFGGYSSPGQIRVPNSTSLQFTTGASFIYWVRLDAAAGMNGYGSNVANGNHCVFAKDYDNNGIYNNMGYTAQNSLYTYLAASSNGGGISTKTQGVKNYAIGNWIHVAFVSSNVASSVYINGVKDSTVNKSINYNISNARDLYFGKYRTTWYPLNGALDEFRIYNRALSDSEVQQIYAKLNTDVHNNTDYGIRVYSIGNSAHIIGATGWEIRVIDVCGRILSASKSDADEYEVKIPVSGLYLIRVSDKEKVCNEKVIIR